MKNQKRMRGISKAKTVKKISAIFLFLCLAAFLGGTAWIFHDIPELDTDAILNAPQALIVCDKDDKEISDLYIDQNRIWISIDSVPQKIRNAFIAVEDIRFYEHSGFDFVRIVAAVLKDIKAGSYVQGASTITQQLVKLSHLTNEKKIIRKIEEVILASRLEEQFTKDQILEMYLNYVYFGRGYYGIEAAAKGYFGVSASEMTAAQGALLAGILKSPSSYAPHLDMEASISRRNLVLKLMQENGFLNLQEYNQALAENVVLRNNDGINERGYYIDAVLKESCGLLKIDMETLLSGGYRIYTAMDTELQLYCQEIFKKDENFPAENVEGALAVIDVNTNGVAALIGGRNGSGALEFNRATDIRRQPGSVIKPILVYAPALEYCGYTTVSMLLDQPMDFNGYQPENFGEKYNGWVTLREAIARSLNVPAVTVLQKIGVQRAVDFASLLGIEFDERDNSLALALGGFTYGVSPLQMAGAYSAFARGGIYNSPTMIRRIENSDGEIVYDYQPQNVQVMSPQNAYVLTDMLQSVVENGTGRRLGNLGFAIAGKTGTTGEKIGNRDAWMAAYTSGYSACVWMGYDTSANGNALANSVTGGTYPARLLEQVFAKIYQERSEPEFEMPQGVKEYRLDKYTLENAHMAVLANALTPSEQIIHEVFAEGTEPTTATRLWQVPAPPTDIVVTLEEGHPEISFSCPDSYIEYVLYRTDENQKTVEVASFAGGDGQAAYTDITAAEGESYSYYVLAIHPFMEIGGEKVAGPASKTVTITLPENAA